MNPATIQAVIDLIPVLTTLIEQISTNIQLAQSTGVTEAQLVKLVSVVTSLTTTTSTALKIAAQQVEQANSTTSATVA